MRAAYIVNSVGERIAYEVTPRKEPVILQVEDQAGELVLRHGTEPVSVPLLIFVIDSRAGERTVRIELSGPTTAMIAAAHVIDDAYEMVAVPWYGGSERVWAELSIMPDTMLTVGKLSLDANDPSPNKTKKFKVRVDPKDTQPPDVEEP